MIDVTLSVTNNETKKVEEYAAILNPEGNGEISLEGDFKKQKFNELVDTIERGDYSLEIFYNGKIANATYELEYNCIVISKDAMKRLLAPTKKLKK
jgi:hypothetical protein